MKNKIIPSLKAVAKYIFVSNPVTVFCAGLAVSLLTANGLSGGAVSNNLLWFTYNETITNAVFYGIVGLVGLVGAGVAGLESNAQADKRKAEAKVAKQERAEKAEAHRLACEKKRAKEQAVFNELLEQAKCELAEKSVLEARLNTVKPQEILGYINSDNVYILTNLDGHLRKCDVTPTSVKTAYGQAKACSASGFLAVTAKGKYGFNEQTGSYCNLPQEQGWQKLGEL